MNILKRAFAKLFGRKKPTPAPDFSDRMAKFENCRVYSGSQRVGKSQGSPSQLRAEASRSDTDPIMSNPMHPLNPMSPISVYSDPTPSHSSSSYDCGSGSSSGYDSGSSSCDSGSSSSSSSD